MSPSHHCTCGPHPEITIDLVDTRKPAANAELVQQVQNACFTHGCFHLCIRLPSDASASPYGDSLRSLVGDLRPQIEELFDPSILNSAKLDANGGVQRNACGATFRGRTSESGASKSPEPKQSWEWMRCSCPNRKFNSQFMNSRLRLNILNQWTDAMHEAALLVIRLAVGGGISTRNTLCESQCLCSGDDNAHPSKCCCTDLLRVFRYDGLSNETERISRPGSSAHTDWGTVTVVWQDTLGGLQTYCHGCEKWSDVKVVPDATTQSNDESISLFVHVGDFLSLATGGTFPSPRHRVLCPVLDNNTKRGSRCSLVYFAYPLPGVPLKDVEDELHLRRNETQDNSICYEQYSLLHDQSATCISDNSQSQRMYERMRNNNFDELIREKWEQVQRK